MAPSLFIVRGKRQLNFLSFQCVSQRAKSFCLSFAPPGTESVRALRRTNDVAVVLIIFQMFPESVLKKKTFSSSFVQFS